MGGRDECDVSEERREGGRPVAGAAPARPEVADAVAGHQECQQREIRVCDERIENHRLHSPESFTSPAQVSSARAACSACSACAPCLAA